MDRSILWRAAAAQVLAVAALSLILAVTLPHSFFDDWGWLTGPVAWLGLRGADGAGRCTSTSAGSCWARCSPGSRARSRCWPGVHWLGVAIAVAAFAAWCAWLARRPGGAAWTSGSRAGRRW